jgi:hypothetical protein
MGRVMLKNHLGVLITFSLCTIFVFRTAGAAYCQEQDDINFDVNLEDSEPFQPDSWAYCTELATKNRATCEEAARASHTEPSELEEALKRCALDHGETLYLTCDCKLLQWPRCGNGPHADCNKDYYRCIVLAGYLKDTCLKSGRPKQECEDAHWDAGKECKRLEQVCVAKIPPQKPSTVLR